MTRPLAQHPPLRPLVRLAGAAVALCFLAAGAGSALAADAVQARAYLVDDGARLVFDWPEPVDFQTTVTPTRLTISFDRPLAATFDAALATLSGRVSDIRITGNGQSIEVTLVEPLFATSFAHDDLVVVDLMPLQAQPEAAAAPEAADPGDSPGPAPVVGPGEEPAAAEAVAPPPPVPAAPASDVADSDAASGPPSGFLAPEDVPIAPSALDPAVGPAALPPQAAPPAQMAAQSPAGAEPRPQPYVPPAQAGADGVLSVRYGFHNNYDRLVFDWPRPVDYTVDNSGGMIRIAFSEAARVDADRLAGQLPSVLRLVDASVVDGGLTVTLAAPPGVRIRDEYWPHGSVYKVVVDVYRDPSGAAPVEVDPDTLAPMARQEAPVAAPEESTPAEDDTPVVATAAPSAEPAVVVPPPPPFPPAVRTDTESVAEAAPAEVPEAATAVAEADAGQAPEHVAETADAADAEAPEPAMPADPVAADPEAAPEAPEETGAGTEVAAMREEGAGTETHAADPADEAVEPARADVEVEVADASAGDGAAAADEPAMEAHVDAGAAPADEPTEVREPGALEVVVIGGETETLMRLRWSVPTRAAVVKRGDRIWVTFDRPAEDFSLDPLTEPMQGEIRPLYEDPNQVEDEGGLVFNVRVPDAIEPRVTASGNTWYIQLRPRDTELAGEVTAQRFEDPALGTAIAYDIEDPGEPMMLEDPQVGDRFVVVPATAAGFGVPQGASFIQFRTLATAQGLAFERLSDDVIVRRGPDRVEVLASGGLTLSDDQAVRDALERAAASEHADASGHDAPSLDPLADASAHEAPEAIAALPRGGATGDFRLFDPRAWSERHRGSLDSVRRELQEQAARARTEAERTEARAEYARFLFARGQYRDAGGMLRLIASETPQAFDRDASLLALSGAVALLNANPEDALLALSDRRLLPSAEAQYWRAAALVGLGRLADAAEVYADQATAPDWYGSELSIPLALAAVDAALAGDDLQHAVALLDQLPYFGLDRQPTAEIALRRADALWRAGDAAGADEQWADVENSGLKGPTARAVLARTRAHYDVGQLEPAAAAAALDAVRFYWRGGAFELDLLRQLAEYHFDAGDFRPGLQTLRHARALFPGHQDAPRIEARMLEAFAALFGSEPPANVSPVTAIALFSEFRDLAPDGPEGVEMLRRLAGRLVSIGLDSDAADVLATLLEQDPRGEERAALGRDLAILYLADRAPDRALEALLRTRSPRTSAGLAAERRHLLASAQLAEEDYAQTLETLDGDLSRPASMLRAEANWRLSDWPAAAEAFGRLVEGDDFLWPPVPGGRAPAAAEPARDATEEDGVPGQAMAEGSESEAAGEDAAAGMIAAGEESGSGLPALMSAEEAAAMDTATPVVAPAAPVAAGFAPHEGTLDDSMAEQVLNWAMALTYAEDGPGLAYLRDVYGTAMNDTPYGATFRLLTASDLGPIDSVADLGRIGTSIDLFSQFLESYRQRLEQELTPEGEGGDIDPLAMDEAEAVTG